MDAPDLPRWAARSAHRLFGTVAKLRDARGLHPKGTTFRGDAQIYPAGAALGPPGSIDVVARLSRGIGLPHPWPDFNGIAIRFVDAHGPDRHQDVLLTASFSAPVLRHTIFPWPTFSVLGYSSVLTFGTEDGPRVLRVEPLAAPTLDAAVESLPLTVELRIAEPRAGWAPAATVVLREVVPADEAAVVRFDPWTTTVTFRPRGILNSLRGPAYAGSREAAPRRP
ncbi:hypothetical protein [Actinomarinicola tropica]|uniref:Phosphodiesterase n=1 Tax=Actinomarinicola tropica TaxID=2789776 RepID=A0A5Q2RRG1_9ACTN|nr:hypothetical protein [Actinomarinicola tropica]QGG95775.1 hypothetical protein GH723_12080 [Actinomarinicola tropica]